VPDFTIPITYTTDTGRTINCSIDFSNGETRWVETEFGAVNYLRAQDWTGLGQRIYDEALARVAAGDPELSKPGEDGDVPDQKTVEAYAWTHAETDLTIGTVPREVMGAGFGSYSHCPRELH
jgi:hypothetical protein